MRYVWATGTHQGRIRERNEDSVFPEASGAGEGPLLAGVADGMGGHVAGNIASTLALTMATEEPADADIEIADRLLAANQAIRDRVSDEPNLAGMGTTMTLGLFSEDGSATIGHVGDSRCYLLRDGELERITSDHTVVAELVALGHIKDEDIDTHPQRHLLTRSLGLGPVTVDTEQLDLEDGDRLLFCSDGLTSMLNDREIKSILGSGSDLEATVWILIEAANAAGGIDNITVAIVDAGAMTRNTEAVFVLAGTVLASVGVAMVQFAAGIWLDSAVALTFFSFVLAFGSLHVAFRMWAPNANTMILPIATFLTALGTIEVFRLDPELAALQRWWLVFAGVAGASVLWLLRTSGVAVLRRYRYLFLAAAMVLLLLPLLPSSWPIHGAVVNGSRLWVRIDLPFAARALSFQPGEVAKVLLTIFLASYLADRSEAMSTVSRTVGPFRIPEPRHLGPVIVAAGVAFIVLVYQRDLGASLLLFGLFIGMLYVATGRGFYLGLGFVLVTIAGGAAYTMFSHVQVRIEAWIDPFADYAGAGYQTAQGLFAMGSGSLTGSGLGLGRPDLIPAAATDFVFAAIGEELGLAGSIAVIVGYAFLVAIGFGIALRSRDRFRKYLAAGLTILLGLQTFLIIAGIVRLFPITGITLPFMSYGGSSLLASAFIAALLGRISHEERT